MIKLNKHGLISKRLIAPEFTVGNTFVEGGGTAEELAVLSLTNEQLAALSYIVNGEGRIIPVGEDGTFDTKIGHSYCIRHTDDLTLHEAWLSNDENLYVKRYGSGQLLFFATSEKCKINDPSYIVTEVFRIAALNDFVDWSGISTTQAWFKEIEVELTELLGTRDKFDLEIVDDNTVVVHTDRVDDELMEAVTALLESALPQGVEVARYNHHIDISWRDINKYVGCVTVDDMLVVNPDYQNDLTSDGQWLYPLPEMTAAPPMNQSSARVFVCNLPKVSRMYASYQGCGFEIVEYNVPNVVDIDSVFRRMPNLHTVNGDFTKIVKSQNAMANNPNLTSFNSTLPNLSHGNGIFYDCRLDKSSALRVLTSIPVYTSGSHPLTVGIHINHQSDDEVLTAIADAESKGWTMTVQWNGTPTSAASTMAMGSLIYAKVGEYELSDGTTEQYLDWGHYVTNPDGYETFRSLESAYSYFDLEMPQMNED